jgi:hypothetical protein
LSREALCEDVNCSGAPFVVWTIGGCSCGCSLVVVVVCAGCTWLADENRANHKIVWGQGHARDCATVTWQSKFDGENKAVVIAVVVVVVWSTCRHFVAQVHVQYLYLYLYLYLYRNICRIHSSRLDYSMHCT